MNDAGKTIFLPVNPITGAVDTSNHLGPKSACSTLQDAGHLLHLHRPATTSRRRASAWTCSGARMCSSTCSGAAASSAGGINGRPTTLAQIQDYKPEHLDSTELGVKTAALTIACAWNNACSTTSTRTSRCCLTEGAPSLSRTRPRPPSTASSRTSRRRSPSTGAVQGSLGYVPQRVQRLARLPGDYTWRKLQDAPEWTANSPAPMSGTCASGAGMRFTANVAFQSWMFLDAREQPGAARAVAHAAGCRVSSTWRRAASWDLGVEGKNLTDQRVLDFRLQRAGVLRLRGRHLQPAAPLLADVPLPAEVREAATWARSSRLRILPLGVFRQLLEQHDAAWVSCSRRAAPDRNR